MPEAGADLPQTVEVGFGDLVVAHVPIDIHDDSHVGTGEVVDHPHEAAQEARQFGVVGSSHGCHFRKGVTRL